jgi:hypothetical protein
VLTSLLLFDFRQQGDLGPQSGGLHQLAGALEAYRSKSIRPGAPPAAIQRRALETEHADELAMQKLAKGLIDQAQSSHQGEEKPMASRENPQLQLAAIVDPNKANHVDPQDEERLREIMNSTIPPELKSQIYEKYLQTGVLPEVKWVDVPTPDARAPAATQADDPYNPSNW